MKKNLIMILMLFLMLISLKKVNAKGIISDRGFEISYEEINRLKNIGFSEEQIYAMEESIFNENKNIVGRVITQKTRFYKTTIVYNDNNLQVNSSDSNFNVVNEEISEEEYNSLSTEMNNSISINRNQPGVVSTEYKQLTSSIIQVGDKYRLKVDLTWKKMPSQRSSDILTLAHNGLTSPIPNSKYFQQIWVYDNPCQNSSERGTSSEGRWKTTVDLYGKVFSLPSDKLCTVPSSNPLVTPTVKTMKIKSLSSYLYYDINKVTSPVHVIDAYGDYAHAVKKVAIDVAFNFGFDGSKPSVGISFTPSLVSSYDEMNTAHAYWDGLNW